MGPLLKSSVAVVSVAAIAGAGYLTIQIHNSQAPAPAATSSMMPSSSASMMPSGSMTPSVSPTVGVRIHTVTKGETLTGISNRAYGNAADWWFIYQANKSKIDKKHGVLHTGETLIIPGVAGSKYTGVPSMTPSGSMMPSAMPSSTPMMTPPSPSSTSMTP